MLGHEVFILFPQPFQGSLTVEEMKVAQQALGVESYLFTL